MGNPGHRARVLAGPGAGDAPIVAPMEVFDPPDDLPADVLAIWAQLAPQAFQARTLTRATEFAFVLLCHNVVLERRAAIADAGGPSHREVRAQLLAELAAFNLRPFGKPIYEAAPAVAVNPLERFLRR